jgi:hypothetical protein
MGSHFRELSSARKDGLDPDVNARHFGSGRGGIIILGAWTLLPIDRPTAANLNVLELSSITR